MEEKKDKIKRTVLYQDLEKGGLRMTDVDLMFKALGLAWIPRLLNAEIKIGAPCQTTILENRGA